MPHKADRATATPATIVIPMLLLVISNAPAGGVPVGGVSVGAATGDSFGGPSVGVSGAVVGGATHPQTSLTSGGKLVQ